MRGLVSLFLIVALGVIIAIPGFRSGGEPDEGVETGIPSSAIESLMDLRQRILSPSSEPLLADFLDRPEPLLTTLPPVLACLPALLFGLLLGVTLYVGGTVLGGRRRAFLSALVAVSTVLFIVHAQSDHPDLAHASFMTLTALTLYPALTRKRTFAWWMLAGLSAGLSYIVVGAPAVLVPVLAALLYLALSPRLLVRLAAPKWIAGLVVFGVLLRAWYGPAFSPRQFSLAMAIAGLDETVSFLRAGFRPEEMRIGLAQLAVLLLPWTLLLPVAVLNLVHWTRHHRGARFLLCWWCVSFLLFALLPGRRDLLLLTIWPPSALALGWFIAPALTRRLGWQRSVVRLHCYALILVFSILGWTLAFSVVLETHFLPQLPSIICGVLLIWAMTWVWPMIRARRSYGLVTATIFMFTVTVYVHVFAILPARSSVSYYTARPLIIQMERALAPTKAE